MFDFSLLRKSLADLGAQIAALRRDLETARREREDLMSAPPPKSDLVAALTGWVDRQAAAFPKSLADSLAVFARNPDRLGASASADKFMRLIVPNPEPGAASLQATVLYLLRAPIKKSLGEAVAAMNWPEAGLPLAERAQRLEALDARIAQLEADEKRLVAEAGKAGVRI